MGRRIRLSRPNLLSLNKKLASFSLLYYVLSKRKCQTFYFSDIIVYKRYGHAIFEVFFYFLEFSLNIVKRKNGPKRLKFLIIAFYALAILHCLDISTLNQKIEIH